ncbi:hypothetical protein Pcar_3400 [Syntrophotalea carbinolica DSM 2380]|uniref:Uncharacterized protein n=1 Tax=Syntrophotalea carbinolica (strain DSM 2380 / NBRC 103641 / GraBd1) TaxID=338963 RepID=Q0C6C4_SYNC1|nr:hypothetical protein Pcar_3400 [Syntrophotalea carbinolica DSM 2380]
MKFILYQGSGSFGILNSWPHIGHFTIPSCILVPVVAQPARMRAATSNPNRTLTRFITISPSSSSCLRWKVFGLLKRQTIQLRRIIIPRFEYFFLKKPQLPMI